jgi:hypothetical protein
MSKKLEDLFQLPPGPSMFDPEPEISTEEIAEYNSTIEESKDMLQATDTVMDKIDFALPTVSDLEASDAEMDSLAKLAEDSFKNMMELSMNVDPRFSGPILQSATALLGHAITAKTAKMDKKLKMISLQLQKARLDVATKNKEAKDPEKETISGEGMILDRNTLLKEVLAANAEANQKANQ